MNIEDAVMWIITFLLLVEGYIAAATAWRKRPMVGRDPNTGRIRSVRLMARERTR